MSEWYTRCVPCGADVLKGQLSAHRCITTVEVEPAEKIVGPRTPWSPVEIAPHEVGKE